MSFNAVANEEKRQIDLYWSTASEIQNKGFDLQRRSEDETTFESIGWQDGQALSTTFANYVFQDKNVNRGINYYYRLRQVDTDGQETYSEIVIAALKGTAKEIDVFPNPTFGLSTVRFSNNIKGRVAMEILNTQGQVIGAQLFDTDGNARLEVDLSKQAEGVYFLRFEIDGVQTVKRMLLKK